MGEAHRAQSAASTSYSSRAATTWASASRKFPHRMPDRLVAAEMGGKNAVIVCDDARFDLAVTAGIVSAFKTTRSALRLRQPHPRPRIADGSLCPAFADTAKRLKFGDPLDPHNFAGPVIHRESVEKVLRLQRPGEAGRGARCCWMAAKCSRSPTRRGCYLSPFVYQIESKPKPALDSRGSLRSARRPDPVPGR